MHYTSISNNCEHLVEFAFFRNIIYKHTVLTGTRTFWSVFTSTHTKTCLLVKKKIEGLLLYPNVPPTSRSPTHTQPPCHFLASRRLQEYKTDLLFMLRFAAVHKLCARIM